MNQTAPIQADHPSMDLLVSSNMTTSYGSSTHDPANFIARLPNSTMISKVVKCVPKLLAIPRMFNNVDDSNNQMLVKFGNLNDTITIPDVLVTIPPGLYTIERLIEKMNTFLPFEAFKLQLSPDGFIVPRPALYGNNMLPIHIAVPPNSLMPRLLGWPRLSSSVQDAVYVLPQDLSGNILPQLGGPQCVTVSLRCVGGQVINAQDGCEMDTLVVVPMTCAVGETAFFQAQDVFVHDIDHNTQPRNYSTLEIHLTDTVTGRKLTLPSLLTVTMLLKLFHVDTLKE